VSVIFYPSKFTVFKLVKHIKLVKSHKTINNYKLVFKWSMKLGKA